ncbi:MAG: 3-phosphoshikimate 1-carboxyvinyltransferase [Tenacibaculum sp.]
MKLRLQAHSTAIRSEIEVSGSKSESNRLLILQQLYPNLKIENLSDSDDSQYLQKALLCSDTNIDIGHAGTAMRFLTAFFASKKGVVKILQGSNRMHNRPVKVLVEALRFLGAKISYVEKEGYPPIKIIGQTLTKKKVLVKGDVSSQYISALMLIAPSLTNGLAIELIGSITSVPYINMTLSLLRQIGVRASFQDRIIQIEHQPLIDTQTVVVESDWSSASYFYSLIALSALNSKISLTAYKKNSLQGDAALAQIYQHFGVITQFTSKGISISKISKHKTEALVQDLNNTPDLAQTIVPTCLGLGIDCNLTGLHTLKIKESDRLEALCTELIKLGAKVVVNDNSLHLQANHKINNNISIATYNDHRMAMAFAPLALKTALYIEDAEVVTKSYRNFWSDIKKIGLKVQEV